VLSLSSSAFLSKTFSLSPSPQVLRDPTASDAKRAGHAASLRREVDVLRRLRGGLNVASLEDVYEDDEAIHLVLELCAGGELWHAIGERHYSERTAASYMRAVLRTLAQCHAAGILHRDVKPGNFMLLSSDERAPIKAVDFGLAVFYDKGGPPREDLGLEGTPWFMAPEVLASKVGPEADVWAAGVMAFQLLSGRFPFDDRSSPAAPALAKVWKAILTDKLVMKGSSWEGVSEEAKEFVKWLLAREPGDRPTAAEALAHPWLRGKSSERSTGRPLSLAVVQRVQRYASSSLFKRTVLQCIAQALLEAGSVHGGQEKRADGGGAPACALDTKARPILAGPSDCALQYLYSVLEFGDAPDACISREALVEGLETLGYRLGDGEAERLLAQLGDAPRISRAALAASQIDWAAVQEKHAGAWTKAARAAFDAFDGDRDGMIKREEMVAALAGKAPPAEVDAAVAHAMAEAWQRDDSVRDGLSFEAFVRMLASDGNGTDALELYEDRLSSWHGGEGAAGALAKAGGGAAPALASVAEEGK
jgi:calcium-dependent protein kinase